MSVGVFNAETNETKDVANKSRTAIIDSEMSEESQNPLQNRVITQKITELNQSIEELNTLLNGMDETLGGKLDVSKIANNLVTTEEGYALDARMGKALKEQIGNLVFYVTDNPNNRENTISIGFCFYNNEFYVIFNYNWISIEMKHDGKVRYFYGDSGWSKSIDEM